MTLADLFVAFLSRSRLDFLLLYFASCVTADLKLEVVELEIVVLFFFLIAYSGINQASFVRL